MLITPSAAELAPTPRREPAIVRPIAVAGSARGALYVHAALRKAEERIRSAGLRHPTILNEACSLMRFVKSGLLSEAELFGVLWHAAQQAGKDDPREVARIMEFAKANAAEAGLPLGIKNG